ncbi:hypothetical protein B296_00011582 [Ensete ventricosum]|uniref:Uncharacterized protein n=1 Tax=Ensete ventricosum TaxID=4639 RepID=A0A426Z9X0_ENSVE|nr:hypothetical protein B296_00011582 [Ensete ventricosum]
MAVTIDRGQGKRTDGGAVHRLRRDGRKRTERIHMTSPFLASVATVRVLGSSEPINSLTRVGRPKMENRNKPTIRTGRGLNLDGPVRTFEVIYGLRYNDSQHFASINFNRYLIE